MTQSYYTKTDFTFKGDVKQIFIESYENPGSLDNTETGKKLSSDKKVFINDKGRIDSIYYYHHGELGLRTIFEIEENLKSKEIVYSHSDGSIQKTITHTHKQGNEFEFVTLDAGNRIAEKGVKFIENDLVLKEQYDYYGTTKYKTDFKYDDENRLLLQIRIRENTDLIYDISYKYLAFDKNGNWTQRLIMHKNEEGAITFSSFEISKYEYY